MSYVFEEVFKGGGKGPSANGYHQAQNRPHQGFACRGYLLLAPAGKNKHKSGYKYGNHGDWDN